MNGTPSKAMIDDSANVIARIVSEMDTDYRGDVFSITADLLAKKGQHYTGNLFRKMAEEYGCHK